MQRVGPYELLSILGQGGMGTVHEARHVELGAVRAVKLLLVKRGGTPADVGRVEARFAREAQALANVRHANVVAIHDSGVHQGAPWFAMDLVEGEPLDELLERGPLPLAQALDLMIGVSRGVDALHAAGVVHRDLKPGNIIVTTAGAPVVIDLGLAIAPERDERLTMTGALVGTPNYMAPEQIEGRNVAPRTDVHALGLILYEVLTGAVALGEGHTSVHHVVGAVIAGERPVPSDKDPELPVSLDRVCLRAMARDPARRFERAGELADALEAVKASPGTRRRTARARVRALVGLGTLVTVGLGVTAALLPGGGSTSTATTGTGSVTSTTSETSRDAPKDDLAARELGVVRRARQPERRRELAEAWLAKHGATHASAPEAQAIVRRSFREAPVARLDHGGVGLTLGAFMGDGGLAFTAGADATVREWRPDAKGEWRETRRLAAGGAVITLGRSRERKRLVLSVKGGQVWRVKALEPTEGLSQLPNLRDLTAICVSPDAVWVGMAQGVKEMGRHLVDVVELEATPQRVRYGTAGARSPFHALAITSRCVLLGAIGVPFTDGNERLDVPRALMCWDGTTGAERWRIDKLAEVSCLAVSNDERLVAAGTSAGEVFIVDVMVGPEGPQRELKGAGAERSRGGLSAHGAHQGGVKALAFSDDDARLYTVADRADGLPGGELRVWSVADGRELRDEVACSAPGATLDVSPDGELLLLSTRDGRVEVWSAAVD